MTGIEAAIHPGEESESGEEAGKERTWLIFAGIHLIAVVFRLVGTILRLYPCVPSVNSAMPGFRLTLALWFGGEIPLENFFVQLGEPDER